jgi:hypothetical protein
MNGTETTIQDKARDAAQWFESVRRDESDENSSYVRLKEHAPDWVKEIVYTAHGDFLPDDWRYDKIQDALEYISDSDDPEDSAEFADNAVDVYTGARFAWLSSNLNRAGYVDEGVENFGHSDQGIVGEIGLGQYEEAGEIYGLVLRALDES